MIKEDENKFWVVANADFPTQVSYMHLNYDSAKDEAIRLSRKTHHKFIVLEAIASYEVDDVTESIYRDPDWVPF